MRYLVDIGPLIPVLATSAHNAYELAVLAAGGPKTITEDTPLVYLLDPERSFPCPVEVFT